MPIKNFNILAERLKGIKVGEEQLTPEKLIELQSSETEVELSASEGSFLLNTEIDELKNTVGNGSMKDGVISGAEQTIKAIKKATGLDYEGKVVKNSEGLVDFDATIGKLKTELTGTIEKSLKIPKDSKIEELEKSLEKLRETYESDTSRLKADNQSWEQKFSGLQKDNYLTQFTSQIKEHKPSHVLAALKADGYDIDLSNGTPVMMLNGNPVKDKLEKPVPVDEVFTSWATENKYLTAQGGRGAGDETGGKSSKFQNMQDAYSYMQENNIDPSSPEAQKVIEQVGD